MVNPLDLMKNLQQMQKTMQEMQERMQFITAEGSAGGDLVKVTVNGQFDVQKVSLAPECVDPRDIPMLTDLIRLATNDALAKVKEKIKTEMGPMTQGLNLPGMLGGGS